MTRPFAGDEDAGALRSRSASGCGAAQRSTTPASTTSCSAASSKPQVHRLRHPQPVGSYGWNVLGIDDGNDYRRGLRRAQGDGGLGPGGPATDDPRRQDGQGLVAGCDVKRRASRAMASRSSATPPTRTDSRMNSDYFVALANTFERASESSSTGIRDGAVKDNRTGCPVQDERGQASCRSWNQGRPWELAGGAARHHR
jgi:hypothetical protein